VHHSAKLVQKLCLHRRAITFVAAEPGRGASGNLQGPASNLDSAAWLFLLRPTGLLAFSEDQLPYTVHPDNWQELQVSVVATPTPLANPPKRLAPSLTWAPTFHFAPNETAEGMEHSIRMFNNVGMTTIPQDGCRNLQPSVNPQSYYTLEQRAQLDFWKGLKYGPQISSFYQSFNGIGMCVAVSATVAARSTSFM
jgi:hypothetical protein